MHTVICRLFLLTVVGLVATTSVAAEPNAAPVTDPKAPATGTQPLPPPPMPKHYKPPEADAAAEELQPEVRITTKGDEIHQEYRINGRLYMVKVTPALGPPYYLIDQEGAGNFIRSGIQPEVNPPMWVIKEF